MRKGCWLWTISAHLGEGGNFSSNVDGDGISFGATNNALGSAHSPEEPPALPLALAFAFEPRSASSGV